MLIIYPYWILNLDRWQATGGLKPLIIYPYWILNTNEQ